MDLKDLNLFRRGIAWKADVQQALSQHARRLQVVETELVGLNGRHELLEREHRQLQREYGQLQREQGQLQREHGQLQREHEKLKKVASAMFATVEGGLEGDDAWFGRHERYYYAQRGNCVRLLRISTYMKPPTWLAGLDADYILTLVSLGRLDAIEASLLNEDYSVGPWESQPWLLNRLRELPEIYGARLLLLQVPRAVTKSEGLVVGASELFFADALAALRGSPELIDFVVYAELVNAAKTAAASAVAPLPFDDPNLLPSYSLPAEPKRNSAIFLHNSYYHFDTLARALRCRGWDAITVSVESPQSANRQFYLGEDLNLFHEDAPTRQRQIREFLRSVPERFGALHFYGRGSASFFQENFENNLAQRTVVPWDFLELRRHRITIGYAPSGCLDGGRQSSIRQISQNACGRCAWESRPDVCSDVSNRAWASTLDRLCDWVGLEGDFAVDERTGPKFVRGPVTVALDPDYWNPDLVIDAATRVTREEREILVYHAVGNLETRRTNGRDIKGSGAVEVAISKLRADGVPITLFFAANLPIADVRYYKAQADIVVDQLNYGRIGANARESFMMGKPVITRLMPEQQFPVPPLRAVLEAPALNSSEATIETVLRRLALDSGLRETMSRSAREYALRWYAADECARRYEIVVDRVKRGLVPETEELYPQPVVSPLAEPSYGAFSQPLLLGRAAVPRGDL